MENARSLAERIFLAALKEADPAAVIERRQEEVRVRYRDGGFRRLLVVGFGKAASPMTHALLTGLDDLVTGGIVVTKYGHAKPSLPEKIRVFEAGHPVPDTNGERATREVVELLRGAGEDTLVVLLISGGGSALLVAPWHGITLDAKRLTTALLLRSGAEITALNTVRKHLSLVKGGRLAALAAPARILSLILSDVIGDPLDVIASGPTAPDPTTYGDALAVLTHLGLGETVPRSVLTVLRDGAAGLLPETPKPGNPLFERVEHIIVGSNRLAMDGALRAAVDLGLRAELAPGVVAGEAREAAARLARTALARRRQGAGNLTLCLISGGETTVTVTGSGTGGRNMELALAFALEVEGIPGITLLSAGTDGTDGPTDAAGAVVDGTTAALARAAGHDPAAYLANNDSYAFFRACGGLLMTGPTGTNVMDVQIILLA